jgi:hypothetical protein
MIERLGKLQATRGQFSSMNELTSVIASDYTLRREIETLSEVFLHKSVSGCSNCHADACMELITLSIEKAMEAMKTSKFELIRGILLRDTVNMDISLHMTQANITDERSLYHLKTNPASKKFFAKLPEDWEALVKAYAIVESESGK